MNLRQKLIELWCTSLKSSHYSVQLYTGTDHHVACNALQYKHACSFPSWDIITQLCQHATQHSREEAESKHYYRSRGTDTLNTLTGDTKLQHKGSPGICLSLCHISAHTLPVICLEWKLLNLSHTKVSQLLLPCHHYQLSYRRSGCFHLPHTPPYVIILLKWTKRTWWYSCKVWVFIFLFLLRLMFRI